MCVHRHTILQDVYVLNDEEREAVDGWGALESRRASNIYKNMERLMNNTTVPLPAIQEVNSARRYLAMHEYYNSQHIPALD